VTFEEWWETKGCGGYYDAQAAWQAAQQAERERILKIVEQVGIQGNHNEWFDCCDTIVERIENEF
jgi:hypothetical protein